MKKLIELFGYLKAKAFLPFFLSFILGIFISFFAFYFFPFFFPQFFKSGVFTFFKDQLLFHELACRVASLDWSQFSFRPDGQFPAGVLAFFYKTTGFYHPAIMLPLQFLLFGISVSSILRILELFDINGRYWTLFICLLITLTPTSVPWLIYPHKDSFVLAGILLLTQAYLGNLKKGFNFTQVLLLILGSFLMVVTKPYFAELLLIGSVLFLGIYLLGRIRLQINAGNFLFVLFSCLFFYVLSVKTIGYSKITEPNKVADLVKNQNEKQIVHGSTFNANWQHFKESKIINRFFYSLAFTRARFLEKNVHAHTNFMPSHELKNVQEVVTFIPKILQLTILEPLPWTNPGGNFLGRALFFLLKIEMLFTYFIIICLIFLGKRSLSLPLLFTLAFSAPFLMAFGFGAPNIGTVNRYRFPFLVLFKIAAFITIWNSSRNKFPGSFLKWINPPQINRNKKKVLFLVPDDATFLIQRLVMAQGIQKADYDVHVASEDTGVSNKIRELGFTFHHLDLNRGGINPFADFFPFIKLVFFLSKQRPDILQCVSIKPVLYGATAGSIVGIKRIVCLVNGLGYAFDGKGIKGKAIKIIASALYKNALAFPGIKVIFQNPDDRTYFVENKFVEKSKTTLIRGSGVDMQKFKSSPLPENNVPIVLFVGRLLWNKGVKELIEAAQQLKPILNFKLIVVGAPDERNPEAVPMSYLKEYNDLGIIEWVGRQADMPSFYRQADIVCLPTQYKEGLPLTLLEAASIGRPLIATDVPGCREIVRNGENGLLVKSKDVKSLRDALEILIKDADLRKEYGAKSSEIVRAEFSSEIIQKQLVEVYESLLNDSVPLNNNV